MHFTERSLNFSFCLKKKNLKPKHLKETCLNWFCFGLLSSFERIRLVFFSEGPRELGFFLFAVGRLTDEIRQGVSVDYDIRR